MEPDFRKTLEREHILKNILSSPAGYDWDHDKTWNMVVGDSKASLHITGTIDWDDPTIQRRLERVGALEQAQTEAFLQGLFLGTMSAINPAVAEELLEVLLLAAEEME